MQHEQPEPFSLPDWGTDGAPPEPPTDQPPADDPSNGLDITFDVTPELVRVVGPIPGRYRVIAVLGFVAAEGAAVVSDDAAFIDAAAAARAAALDRLSSEASTMGATVVADIRLMSVTRLNDVVVTAYGTAYDASTSD